MVPFLIGINYSFGTQTQTFPPLYSGMGPNDQHLVPPAALQPRKTLTLSTRLPCFLHTFCSKSFIPFPPELAPLIFNCDFLSEKLFLLNRRSFEVVPEHRKYDSFHPLLCISWVGGTPVGLIPPPLLLVLAKLPNCGPTLSP